MSQYALYTTPRHHDIATGTPDTCPTYCTSLSLLHVFNARCSHQRSTMFCSYYLQLHPARRWPARAADLYCTLLCTPGLVYICGRPSPGPRTFPVSLSPSLPGHSQIEGTSLHPPFSCSTLTHNVPLALFGFLPSSYILALGAIIHIGPALWPVSCIDFDVRTLARTHKIDKVSAVDKDEEMFCQYSTR